MQRNLSESAPLRRSSRSKSIYARYVDNEINLEALMCIATCFDNLSCNANFDPTIAIKSVAANPRWQNAGRHFLFFTTQPAGVNQVEHSDSETLKELSAIVNKETNTWSTHFYKFFCMNSPMTEEFYELIRLSSERKDMTNPVIKYAIDAFCDKWHIDKTQIATNKLIKLSA